MKSARSHAYLAAALLLAGCTLFPPLPPPPTPEEIVALAREGKPAQEIIGRIDAAQAVYRMSASELARLREQGVPDAVIDHMQAGYLDAVRREELWRQHGLYPGSWFYGSQFRPPGWWRR